MIFSSQTGPFVPARSRTSGLTLLELIGVIVILAILAGLVFPATDAVRRSMKERQARAEVHAIARAVTDYRATYGQWPLVNNQNDDRKDLIIYHDPKDPVASNVDEFDQADLIAALMPSPDNVNTNNPRQIRFLDIPLDRIDEDGRFTDPWSNERQSFPYVVVVNAEGEEYIGSSSRDGANNTVSPVMIYSGKFTNEICTVHDSIVVFSWSMTGVSSNRVSTISESK